VRLLWHGLTRPASGIGYGLGCDASGSGGGTVA
jgi:hypothetical protein